jgi:hypothetical protein
LFVHLWTDRPLLHAGRTIGPVWVRLGAQELVPHLEFMELTRCGHEPWRERHARASFVETVLRWLNRKPA